MSHETVFGVVTVPTASASIAERLLPRTGYTIRSADRTYFVFALSEGVELSYMDPLDGEPLIDAQTFITLDAARRWIHSDIRYRGWRSQ
jgi:hypothetical protein